MNTAYGLANQTVNTGSSVIFETVTANEGITVKRTLTAASGNSFTAGKLGFLTSTGIKLTDASASATAIGDLYLALGTVSAGSSGAFLELGDFTTTGLTEGPLFMSETAGDLTSTAPTTSSAVVRILGHAKTTTVLNFKPEQSYTVIA